MSLTAAPPLHQLTPKTLVVPTRWRTTSELRIDPVGIWWDGVEVRFSDITAVAYGVRPRTRNLIQSGLERRVEIWSPAGDISLAMGTTPFSSRQEVQREAYGAVIDAIHGSVEDRLCSDLLRRLATGGTVQVDGLRIDREGITSDSTSGAAITWEALPAASIEGTRVNVQVATNRPRPLTLSVSTLSPNAVLLPDLLAEAAEVFC